MDKIIAALDKAIIHMQGDAKRATNQLDKEYMDKNVKELVDARNQAVVIQLLNRG